MIERSQTDRLSDEIWKTINYFRKEYELTYSQMIGVLEIVKLDMYKELDGLDDNSDG